MFSGWVWVHCMGAVGELRCMGKVCGCCWGGAEVGVLSMWVQCGWE